MRVLRYYNFKREEFLQFYHRRSNVETTFHMIKAKFGGRVRSKTQIAATNEILCKVLSHNLCVLVQSIYELGIEATFWSQQSA
jgi:transposase